MLLRAEVDGGVDLFELHRRNPERYPFLLESVAAHSQTGRYDLLFAAPEEVIEGADFFGRLAQAFEGERARCVDTDTGLPFVGGWFLLLCYEAAAELEPRLHFPAHPYRLPRALALRCRSAILRDRLSGRTHLITESEPAALRRLQRDYAAARAPTPDAQDPLRVLDLREEPPERYLEGVRRIQEYLRAGDAFQVNLSRGWSARLGAGDHRALYPRLRRSNPAPFAGLALWRGSAVLSSSPERLLSVRDGWAQTRPIAGTRPRSTDAEADAGLRAALAGSLKERAEHVMLIDLERNDLGRVSEPGSVEVDALMSIESYAHVHHIVSSVRGRLRPGATPVDALRAVFPGGTITGCPKPRVMQIIAEIEGIGRGPYTGAMGYLSRCGRLDSNILIRSLLCEDGRVHLRAGGGIVADSEPEAELAETRAKARGLLMALDPPTERA